MTKLKPLSDLIIVEPDEPISKIGLIELAPSAQEEAKQGKVIAVGPGKLLDGWVEPMEIRVGQTVLYSRYAKEHFAHRGKELLVLHQSDVIGILSD